MQPRRERVSHQRQLAVHLGTVVLQRHLRLLELRDFLHGDGVLHFELQRLSALRLGYLPNRLQCVDARLQRLEVVRRRCVPNQQRLRVRPLIGLPVRLLRSGHLPVPDLGFLRQRLLRRIARRFLGNTSQGASTKRSRRPELAGKAAEFSPSLLPGSRP